MKPLWLLLLCAAVASAEPLVLTATLQPKKSADVFGYLSEVVQRVMVQVGDQVAEGDTLAQLDDTEFRLSEASARIAYLKVQGYLARAEALYAQKGLSKQEIETIRFQAVTARLQHQRALLDLSRCIILAPISGVVAECGIQPRDLTSPRQQLFQIVTMDDLKADLFIPADQVGAVHLNQAVTARPLASPEQPIQGKIVRISPVLDPESGTCQVLAIFPGAGRRLKPGTVARVELEQE